MTHRYDNREAFIRWMEDNPDRMDDDLPVSEVFGPTIQGEGPHAGRPCWFIRLGGCNLSCTWCDTPYSTGQHGIPLSTIPRRSVEGALRTIPAQSLVVLTGGEPLMHAKRPGFTTLLYMLQARGCEVHVETNGTIAPPLVLADLIDHYTVSPKLGVEMVKRSHRPTLADWSGLADRVAFKFVVDSDDADAAARHSITIAAECGVPPRRVWLMPEGATAEALADKWRPVAEAAARAGINASHRLHALAWGDAKGH